MIKRGFFANIFIFLFGVIISVFIDSHFRNIIQDLYPILTNDSIYFEGKGLYFFPSFLQCFGFGIWMVIIWKNIFPLNKMQRFWNGLLVVGLFAFTLVLLCFFDSNLKVMECTMCDNGRLGIKHSEINYGVLVCWSLFVSILPIALKRVIKWIQDIFQNDPEDVLDLELEKL